jgi:pantothenate kinase
LDVPREVRIDRLVKRHKEFGKSAEQARAWALGPDEVNARFIRATRQFADQTIDVAGVGRSLISYL